MNILLTDFYFEIDPIEKRIISPLEKLEINWKNISGLPYLSKEELLDLSWAGYPRHGFLKFSKENENIFKKFTYDDSLLNVIKSQIKNQISSFRYKIECGGVIINNRYEMQTNDRSKISMQLKYLECLSNPNLQFKWKTKTGFIDFESVEFMILTIKIQKFFQKLFDIEFELFKKVEECNSILDILLIDFDKVSWTSNAIKLECETIV